MALINTPEELKAHIAIGETTTLNHIMPYVNEAEQKHIVPILGKDLYNELIEALEADTPEAKYMELLPYVQKPLANFSYCIFLPISAVNLSAGGVRTDRETAAFKWQHDKVEQTFLDIGYRAIDELLKYLEANASTFQSWKDSDAYTLYTDQFIKDAATFNKFVFIDSSRRTFIRLQNSINEVELFTIKPLLTPALYDFVKTSITASEPVPKHEAIIPLVRPILAHLSIARAITSMNMQITALGAIEYATKATSGGNKEEQKAAKEERQSFKHQAEKTAETYIKHLVDFLNSNIDDYPEFKNSSSYVEASSSEPSVGGDTATYNMI